MTEKDEALPMSVSPPFPLLAGDWEPTRAVLHAYSRVLCALPEGMLPHHPAWWHTSLTVGPDGLRTRNLPLPGGGAAAGRLDLLRHRITLSASCGETVSFDLREGRTAAEMANGLNAALREWGGAGDYRPEDLESRVPLRYRPQAVAPFRRALVSAAGAFESHRAGLPFREVGPVQFWSHGFDLSVEWFGARRVEYEGAMQPVQINLGFYPNGDRPYFYSNPFPFTEEMARNPLPVGEWHDAEFRGSILYYDRVAERPDGLRLLKTYAAEVYQAARPALAD